ncbi:MAG TPA: metal-dependent hydrolase [Marinobacter sp.]|jgi:inner membrane protein|nr:metal-dependent hydrolase [Marinobacter sp.]
MDSITQAALGASLAGAIAGKTLGRSVLITGAVIGTLPDLDVVIDYGTAVANFTQHRGFSHSLFILAPVSLLLAWLLWRWRPQLSYRRWLALAGLILITHPILDSFTTYGTQLFWPFGDPVALNTLFIIDPLYTLPLLIGCLAFALRPPAKAWVMAGLAVSTLYIGWSLVAQQWISQRIEPALAEAGLGDARVMIQPMPFSTILWRATALTGDTRVEIVTGFLDRDDSVTLEYFPRNTDIRKALAGLPEAQRLEWFTKGFLAYERDGDKLVATDIRLGLPGAHPFAFVLAEQTGGELKPRPSTQLPRPGLDLDALPLLWGRTTGDLPVLCLASLSVPVQGSQC